MKNKYAIPVSERITYGFGNLAANLMITTANAFITYFYTDCCLRVYLMVLVT